MSSLKNPRLQSGSIKEFICMIFDHKWEQKMGGKLCSRCRLFQSSRICTRRHQCAQKSEGPCNGWPRTNYLDDLLRRLNQ